MIVRVKRAKSGLSQYIRDGKKADSIYNRDDKDIVTPIWGNLDAFEKAENYCVENKNWSENYMHITFGFSDNDWIKIESLPTKNEQNVLMQELVLDYIKHHFSGYDIDNEIISYAELHYPKIKYDEYGNKRYPHIHLGISFLNSLSDTKLRNLFANNSFYDELMVKKTSFKFGFQQTKKREVRVKNFDSQVGRDRNEWIELLDDLNDREELVYFLENQMNFKEGIDYRVVNTKNNNDGNPKPREGIEKLSEFIKKAMNNKCSYQKKFHNSLTNLAKTIANFDEETNFEKSLKSFKLDLEDTINQYNMLKKELIKNINIK